MQGLLLLTTTEYQHLGLPSCLKQPQAAHNTQKNGFRDTGRASGKNRDPEGQETKEAELACLERAPRPQPEAVGVRERREPGRSRWSELKGWNGEASEAPVAEFPEQRIGQERAAQRELGGNPGVPLKHSAER